MYSARKKRYSYATTKNDEGRVTMRLGFTGTRSIPDDRVFEVEAFLRGATWHEPFTEFTTGACIGFDALAARWLLKHKPDAVHRLCVPSDRSRVDTDLFHEFLTSSAETRIECMPDGTKYRFRNERIVSHSDLVLAVADYPEFHPKSKRSGTWMTVRIARDAGVPVREFVLNEDAA